MRNPFLYVLVALLVVTSFKFYGCETVQCSDIAREYEAAFSKHGSLEGVVLDMHTKYELGNKTALVKTPQELRAGLGQKTTTCIIIANDLSLRWYNGWKDGALFIADKVVRYTNVTVVGVVRNGRRPEIDFGGVQLLGKSLSLIELTLRLESLSLKNVAPVRKEALRVVYPGRVFINDSLVHLKGTQEDLAQIIIRPTAEVGQSTADGTTYESYSCPVDVTNIKCPKGGLYVKNISLPLGSMATSKIEAAFSMTKSVVTMERFQSRPVASPLELETYIGETQVQGLIVTPLPPYTLDMQQATSCSSPGTGLVLDHDLVIDGRKGNPSFAFLDIKQAENCLTVGKGVTLQLQGVVVDDSAEEGRLKSNFLPFFQMEANSTIFLEGTVISVVPNSNTLTLEDVEKEIESTFFYFGGVNITKMTLDDFLDMHRLLESSFRDRNAPGLLVHNAALRNKNGATYKLVHSFIMIDDSYFHKEKYSLFLPIFVSLLLFLVISTVLAIIATKYKWKRKAAMFFQSQRNVSESDPRRRLLGERTVDEELKIMTKSSDDTHIGLHHEHQVVAEKLLESLTLGNVIGRGGFGQVYKATWNGAVVAVKVIFHRENAACGDECAAREAALSANLRHPNVVQTFMQATRILTESSDKSSSAMSFGMDENPYIGIQDLYNNGADSNSDSADQSPYRVPLMQHKETWLVQEHCDLGSLGQSIKMKLLHRGDKVDLNIVLLTCADIARGMEYLHSRNVIHGDLKCTNVLLCSSVQDPRGFVAKVADFGLSREMAVNVTHISTNTVGTLTHMPPELLRGGKLVPKGDVYSFGIMMWEILMGKSPFQGWTAPQVLRSVLNQKWRPTFPEFAPHGFNELGVQCLREQPEDRPSFCEVLKRLEDLRQLAKS